MALDPTILAEQLMQLGDPNNPGFVGIGTSMQAPSRLASAYDAYAQGAVDAGGNKLLFGNLPAMQAALATVFAVPIQSAVDAAQGLGAAHAAYWAGAAFAPGTPPTALGIGGTGVFAATLTSLVTGAPIGTFVPGLTSFFNNPTPDGQGRMYAVAQLWHTTTLQVLITMTGIDTTPPPVGPLPVVLQAFAA